MPGRHTVQNIIPFAYWYDPSKAEELSGTLASEQPWSLRSLVIALGAAVDELTPAYEELRTQFVATMPVPQLRVAYGPAALMLTDLRRHQLGWKFAMFVHQAVTGNCREGLPEYFSAFRACWPENAARLAAVDLELPCDLLAESMGSGPGTTSGAGDRRKSPAVDRPNASGTKPTTNAPVLDLLTRKPDSQHWTCREIGDEIHKSKSQVAACPAYKHLAVLRGMARMERVEKTEKANQSGRRNRTK